VHELLAALDEYAIVVRRRSQDGARRGADWLPLTASERGAGHLRWCWRLHGALHPGDIATLANFRELDLGVQQQRCEDGVREDDIIRIFPLGLLEIGQPQQATRGHVE